jgi:ribosomal-protein-alanine N-acetyltransferase
MQAIQSINWAVTMSGNPALIGVTGLYQIEAQHHRCQLGYMLMPEYTGQGISTESAALMLQFAFENLNMHSMEALIDPRNIASEKVLLKNGFTKEGHLTENVRFREEFLDTIIYSLLRRNYHR